MADFELKSLRVSAEMDASKYTAGAAQKVSADQKMVQSGRDVSVSVTQTETKISQAGDVLARLSKQYVDGYGAAQRFNSALNQLSNGIERGKITMQQAETILGGISQKYGLMGDAAQFAVKGQTEFAAAVTRSNGKLAEQKFWHEQWLREFNKQPIPPANQNQGGLARFGSLNATSQFQDIAITAAMGQSPLTIALQQGTQLGMALEQQLGNQGIKGLIGGLSSAFMGLLTPVNLVAIGLTGVVAVAIQFGAKLIPQVKSLKEATEDQRKAVTELAEAYGLAGIKAEEFGKKSREEASAAVRISTDQLRKSAAQANLDAIAGMTTQLPIGRGAIGGAGLTSFVFKDFNDAIQKLNRDIKTGHPDFDAFEKSVEGVVAQNPGLRTTADRIIAIAEAAAGAARDISKTVGMLDQLNKIRLPEAGNLGTFPQFNLQDQAAQDRLRKQFEAEAGGIGARSPQELAAAARAREAAANPEGSAGERSTRIELAGKRALIEAEQQLKDAQDERKRSLDQTLDSAKLDVELVGKTTAEIEGLRMAAQLEAQVREEAARNHVAADEAEIANIRQKAEEIGKLKALEQARTIIKGQTDDLELQRTEIGAVGQNKLAHDALIASLKTEQEIRKLGIDPIGKEAEALRANTAAASANAEALAKANLAADLAFERRQIGRTDEEQAISSRLKGAGLADDLNSTEAALIRSNMRLSEAKNDFKGFFSDVVAGFRQGKDAAEAFTDALSNLAGKIADRFLDRALDQLFGSLTGTGGGSTGGLGIIGQLLGIGGSAASTAFPPRPPANDNWLINPANAAALGLNPANFVPGGYPGPMANPGSITGGSGAEAVIGFSGRDRLFPSAGTTRTGIPLAGIGIGNLTAKVDAQYASRFQGLLEDLQARGYPISSLGEGGYSFRTIRGPGLGGSHQLSNHAYGDALDINPRQNPFRRGATGNFDEYGIDAGSLARQHGLKWGGEWRTPDTMHFQVDKSLNDLSQSAKVASSGLKETGIASFNTVKGLADASGGLTKFGSLLSSFMGAGGGSGTGWFQGLASLFGGAGGAISHMMGISPGATGAILAGGALGPAGLYHEGGIAGFPSSMRGVHPGVFIGARRYHMGGLAGDEVPAILRRGEPVFRSMDHARQVVGANQNIDQISSAVAKKLGVNVTAIILQDKNLVGDYIHKNDQADKVIADSRRRAGGGRRF